ncbi:Cys-tRNA(Pro) deacylase [Lapillicoccus jejuensis]|uniref:Cys-tRNA(Pro)/Cys-tRNA(Cys) deacylase n=1 Tax=Lapillicoccus jejuensis TaxID=402171 RepID=A0A542E4T6_9MICO|nr:Cys-tRNA(Pro)/Cys-tRNA(Cys) deacylase [Lapillicoccus jejuensis]
MAGGTPATVALDRGGVPWTAHPYEHDPGAASYGLEAAQALGVEPARVFKTLLVRLEPAGAAPGGLAVGVVPVDRQLDLKAVAAAVGAKRATMAPPDVAERTTGYVVGGISPLGQKRPLRTVVDVSALAHPTVYVSGGRRGFDVELTAADLVRLTAASTAPIAR